MSCQMNDAYFIVHLSIHKNFRCQGLAKMLLAHLAEYINAEYIKAEYIKADNKSG